MPARTGEQFLRGLVDDREIWVGSDKISSPLDHPSLDRSRATRLVDRFLTRSSIRGRRAERRDQALR